MARTAIELVPRLFVAVVLTAGIVTAAYEENPMKVPPPGPNANPGGGGNSTGGGGVHVISWNYEYVKGPLLTSLFLMASGILKLGKNTTIKLYKLGKNTTTKSYKLVKITTRKSYKLGKNTTIKS